MSDYALQTCFIRMQLRYRFRAINRTVAISVQKAVGGSNICIVLDLYLFFFFFRSLILLTCIVFEKTVELAAFKTFFL